MHALCFVHCLISNNLINYVFIELKSRLICITEKSTQLNNIACHQSKSPSHYVVVAAEKLLARLKQSLIITVFRRYQEHPEEVCGCHHAADRRLRVAASISCLYDLEKNAAQAQQQERLIFFYDFCKHLCLMTKSKHIYVSSKRLSIYLHALQLAWLMRQWSL